MGIATVEVITAGPIGPRGLSGAATTIGGTTNQVLGKATDTDYDVAWQTLDAANTVFTTLSDITATTVDAAIEEVNNNIDPVLTVANNATTLANNGISLANTANNSISTINSNITNLTNGTTQLTKASLLPTATASLAAHSVGQIQFDDDKGVFLVDIADGARVSHNDEFMRVINITGATIPKGTPVRHDGVTGGVMKIAPALANTFINATVFGVAYDDILSGTTGIIITDGHIYDMDTSALAVGTPAYLSATSTLTNSTSNILTQVGGALTSAVDGVFKVQIDNNIALPTITGILNGLVGGNEVLSLTTSYQSIIGFTSFHEEAIIANSASGTFTLPGAGIYDVNFTFSGHITAEEINVDIEFYDVTNATSLWVQSLTSGRSLTPTSVPMATSIVIPIVIGTPNTSVVARIKSSSAQTLTINNISFSVKSTNIALF